MEPGDALIPGAVPFFCLTGRCMLVPQRRPTMSEHKELDHEAYVENANILIAARTEQLRAALIRVEALQTALQEAKKVIDAALAKAASAPL